VLRGWTANRSAATAAVGSSRVAFRTRKKRAVALSRWNRTLRRWKGRGLFAKATQRRL